MGNEREVSGAQAQLDLIESMMQEGRKTTEYWGWCFVLWGVAYLTAVVWASSFAGRPASYWAWPVTMTAAGIACAVIARWKSRGKPVTTRSRAIGGMWVAVGFGITLFAFPALAAHRFGDGHLFIAGIEILLGVAHLSSGTVLRWSTQKIVGLLWWSAAVVTLFTHTPAGLAIPFLSATLVCNLGFGVYLMVREARDKSAINAGLVAHV